MAKLYTLEARHGLNLRVRDKATGLPAALDAVATVIDGEYTEVLRRHDELVVSGAVERAGTYDILVAKPGYRTWKRHAVTVERPDVDGHVRGVVIDVDLTPE